MRYQIIFPALVLSLGVLSGCGATRPSKYYQLTVPGDEKTGTDSALYPVTLLLGPIATSNLYRDDHIVYTSRGQAMGTYEYQRWAEPPCEMIKESLLRELQLSSRYQHVYSSRSDVRGDYLLRGRLYDFKEIDGKVYVNDVPDGLVPRVGEFYRCEITESHDYDLVARIL